MPRHSDPVSPIRRRNKLCDVPKHRDGLASELTRSKVGGKVEGVDIVYSILECSQGFSPLMRGGLRPKMDSKIFRMVRDVNTLPVRAHLRQPFPNSRAITIITLEGGKHKYTFCRFERKTRDLAKVLKQFVQSIDVL